MCGLNCRIYAPSSHGSDWTGSVSLVSLIRHISFPFPAHRHIFFSLLLVHSWWPHAGHYTHLTQVLTFHRSNITVQIVTNFSIYTDTFVILRYIISISQLQVGDSLVLSVFAQ